jgi:hypothetical protein
VQAKYGEESRFFDLGDLENTLGSWDMWVPGSLVLMPACLQDSMCLP